MLHLSVNVPHPMKRVHLLEAITVCGHLVPLCLFSISIFEMKSIFIP